MKNHLARLSLIFCLIILSLVDVRAQAYSEGDNLLDIGIGLGSSLAISRNNYGGYNSRTSLPIISINYEKGVHQYVSLGGYFAFTRSTYRNNNWFYNRRHESRIYVGARGSFHFNELINLSDPWDVYAGLGLGASIHNGRETSNSGGEDLKYSDVYLPSLNLFIGGRYYFKDNVAVYTEIGVGPYVNLGVTFKF